MRYYLKDVPKIKLNTANNCGEIIAFLMLFLSPYILPFFRIDDVLYHFFEGVFYFLTLYMAERVIFRERRRNCRCIRKKTKQYNKLFTFSAAICIGISVLLTLISTALSDGISENQASIKQIPIVVQITMAVFYAPVVEEVLFRYTLRLVIKRKCLYIAVSGMFFGLLHILSSIGIYDVSDIIALSLPYIGVGLYLAYIYAYTNCIEACIFIHRALNIFALIPVVIYAER